MTPAPVSMKCLAARPERGAIRPSTSHSISNRIQHHNIISKINARCIQHTSTLRHSNSNARINSSLALSRNDSLLSTVDIIPGSESRAARGCLGSFHKLLHQQWGKRLADGCHGWRSHGVCVCFRLGAFCERGGGEGGRLTGFSFGFGWWSCLFGHGTVNVEVKERGRSKGSKVSKVSSKIAV
jgi:hypothetical protein